MFKWITFALSPATLPRDTHPYFGSCLQMNLIEMLQSMVALTASCCHHNSPDVNTNGDILARELAYLIKGQCVR